MNSETLTVELGERSYPIMVGAGQLAAGFDLSPWLGGRHCLVVSNETVAPLYLSALRPCLGDRDVDAIALPDGERFKTLDTAAGVIDRLVGMRAGRDATVVALGGGVVGDIAGFAAASYMRGIGFVQVPTTLLSQVDSSVGGKTGVNHPGGKNLIGAFHQPRAVLIDTATLASLPEREFRAGLAEIIKYGAIVDIDFFDWLADNMAALLARNEAALAGAIVRSCAIKARVVAADERESGQRALLNFGHTFGHAIENSVGYGEWLHGEAVAAGMAMAAGMSDIDACDRQRLLDLLRAAGLPDRPPPAGADRLRLAMRLDKKVLGDRLRLVLLRRLGEAFVSDDYDPARLDAALQHADA